MNRRHRPDITQGNLTGAIWRLAWPIIIGQLFFMLPGVYDAYWLGKLGSAAQAAAGLTMSVRFTMISVLMALSLGSGAVISHCIGANRQDEANAATLQAVILMIVSSGTLGLVGIVFARPLLSLAGANSITMPLAVRYSRIIFAGLIAMELVPSIGGMVNAAGGPKLMMGMTLLSTGTLLIAEPLLVDRIGLEGAALALIGSNGIGMFWGLGMLVAGRAPVRLDMRNLRLDFPVMARILRVAGPAVLQRGSPNLAMMLVTRLTSSYGALTLAAWILVRRVYQFTLIPGMGLAHSTLAMVGQNLGAAQPERAARSVGLTARAVALVSGSILGVLALFAPQVVSLFTSDTETASIGAVMLRTLSVGQFALMMHYVYASALGGAGDTVSAMTINLIALWLVQVPLAYVIPRVTGIGARGIWIGLIVGWIVQAILALLRFRQGHWKRKQV